MKKKRQNKIRVVLSAVLSFFFLPGCSDWLQVDPIDKITEGRVFNSEENIQQALNGIYIQMGHNSLYGRNLSVTTLELLAQQYALEGSADSNPFKYYMTNHNYSVDTTKSVFLSIWTRTYAAILGINNFIENLNNTESVIIPSRKNILLGEAYGLRAYLHLDLLRLFGPVYLADSTGISIPYRDDTKIEYSERISATQVMDKIIGDLDKSIDLLKEDPVITEGPMAMPVDSLSASQNKIDKFYRYRNRRMNYYAVNALKVRALMYRNNKEAAAALAKKLLEPGAVPDKFPWATNQEVSKSQQEDCIFSKEVLFGIHAPDMYSNWTNLFSSDIRDISNLYVIKADYYSTLFEVSGGNSSTDWRSSNWSEYTTNPSYMVTNKLRRSVKETTFWYFQPLIRKSELYYILAECENDVSYLDEIRSNRSLKKVGEVKPTYVLDDEIQNDFLREMHNEGQIFYFFKRRYQRDIPTASSGTAKVAMSRSDYEIPVPQREIDK